MSFIYFTTALQFDPTCNSERVRLSLGESGWAQFPSKDFGSNSDFKFQIFRALCISPKGKTANPDIADPWRYDGDPGDTMRMPRFAVSPLISPVLDRKKIYKCTTIRKNALIFSPIFLLFISNIFLLFFFYIYIIYIMIIDLILTCPLKVCLDSI